jgi:predicted DNA-binding mobile mystery protein A
MSAAQLGRRLGVSQQEASDLERRERSGSISIATLSKVAEALNCDVKVVFVPKTSLEDSVRAQAEFKAREERDRVVHTMRLETQEAGVEAVLKNRNDSATWLGKRLAVLWD